MVKARKSAGVLDCLLVLIGALLSFPALGEYPFFFIDPNDTDNSWIYALNAAQQLGLGFGKKGSGVFLKNTIQVAIFL